MSAEPRIIKNYDPTNHNITLDFLYNRNEWDLIELNYNIDIEKLQQWYSDLMDSYSYMNFNFNENSDLIKLEISKRMVEEGYCGYYCGPIDGLTLAWPKERYEKLPPPVQADPLKFPEVNYDTFIDDAKLLPKLNFDYFSKLVNDLGEDAFRQAIITTHYPGMYIRQHIDSKVLKLHIPIHSHPDAYFHFGENKERKYHMKEGKIYILNTGDWHGTTNETEFKRSHIITRVTQSQIIEVIEKTNAINQGL
jgi:hypothetical protein